MIQNQEVITNINAAKQGNQTAFNVLLHEYWNEVHLFLKNKINDGTDAEDLAIVTFSKAFDKLDQYNEAYPFKTWLFTIARNLLIDEHRKNKNETISIEQQEKKILSLSDDMPSPEDILINKQNLATLKTNIRKLKPKYQEVINLRYFQDLSYQEIADHLEESINNVKVKLLRAKRLLTEIIQNQQDED